MSEAEFVIELIEGLEQECSKSDITKIESPIVSPGVPDLHMCLDGHEVWVEAKHSGNGRCPEVRHSQVRWFRHRIKGGGKPFVLAKLLIDSDWAYCVIKGEHIWELAQTHDLYVWVKLSSLAVSGDDDELWFQIKKALMS